MKELIAKGGYHDLINEPDMSLTLNTIVEGYFIKADLEKITNPAGEEHIESKTILVPRNDDGVARIEALANKFKESCKHLGATAHLDRKGRKHHFQVWCADCNDYLIDEERDNE